MTAPWGGECNENVLRVVKSDVVKVGAGKLNSDGRRGWLDSRLDVGSAGDAEDELRNPVHCSSQADQRLKITSALVVLGVGSVTSGEVLEG